MASELEEVDSKRSSESVGDSLLEVVVPSSSSFDLESWLKSHGGNGKGRSLSMVLSAPQRQFLLLGGPWKNTSPRTKHLTYC